MEKTFVKDWMTPDPVTIASGTRIPDAYWLMIKNHIRRLLVVDKGNLVGIVTIDDLRQKIPYTTFALDAVRASDILANYPVRELMTKNPISTSPDTTIIQAAKIMLANDISTLPVMVGEKLVGIITEGDIFRAFVESNPEG